jgi:hypothetical protein
LRRKFPKSGEGKPFNGHRVGGSLGNAAIGASASGGARKENRTRRKPGLNIVHLVHRGVFVKKAGVVQPENGLYRLTGSLSSPLPESHGNGAGIGRETRVFLLS